MSRRTRLLHVVLNLNYGGLERVVADVVRRLDRSRFDVHLLGLQYLGRFAEGLGDYATMHVAHSMRGTSLVWPVSLIRQIREIAPDVVHMHSGTWYKASLAARRAGVRRLVHTDHGRRSPDPWADRFIDRLAARRTDVVVAVSEALGWQLAETVVEDSSRIQLVINGIDTETHCPTADTGAVRRELNLAPDVPVVGSIGRLEHIKGYDVMLVAFARLLERWRAGGAPPPLPALVLAGAGSERESLEASALSLGIREHVHFLGWRDDVKNLHSSFAVFTMSSRSEGTSISLLEAMSAGLCPVVTDVGGNGVVLGPELRHRMVPSLDTDGLAAAWFDALVNHEQRQRDAAVARGRVVERFGLDAMVSAYERIYLGEAP